MNKKLNIICFGFLPWSSLWKRNQSMVTEMANFEFINKVVFVNPESSVRNYLSNRLDPAFNLSKYHQFIPRKYQSNIWIYSPFRFLPMKNRLPAMEKAENRLMLQTIKLLNRGQSFILLMNRPVNSLNFILDRLNQKAELSIFDLSDDFVEYYREDAYQKRSSCLTNIKTYAGGADIVVSINEHIRNKYNELNKNIVIVRNATNVKNFQRDRYNSIKDLEYLKSKKKIIIGYSGSFRENRIDFNLLDYLIETKREWEYVFIGDADKVCQERYSKYTNVLILKEVDYQHLPDYLSYFDLAIVPFKINEHTKGNDLLKFHDYLAMGKPIVSTDIGGASDLDNMVNIGHDPTEFIRKMELALLENTQLQTAKRKEFATKNSWKERITQLEIAIRERLEGNL